MKPGFIHLAAIAAGAGLFASCGGSGTPESARQDLVPKSGEVKGWDPNGQATVVNGDELFELIDGGAEIYHEFGFERALSQDYSSPTNQLITLEIFEMEDCSAAYGIYGFKISKRGRPLELGDEAMLEDYYLNLREGRFVVTLTAMDTGDETLRGLVKIAGAVAKKIHENGEVPPIVTQLVDDDMTLGRPYYLRGELALAQVAPLAAGIQFGMVEGAAVRFEGHTEVVLRYPGSDSARLQFDALVRDFATRFSSVSDGEMKGDSAEFENGDDVRIRLTLSGESIEMELSDATVDAGAGNNDGY